MKKSNFIVFALFVSAVSLSSCAELNDPYYSPSSSYGSRDPYYGGGGYYPQDDYYRDQRRRDRDYDRRERERRELERERRRLEEEQERLREERRRQEYEIQQRYTPPPPPPQNIERCPSGFSPSENKCSREERRRGCKDMRLPGGLGCVRR